MSRLFRASVKENKQLTDNHYLITLHPLGKIKKPKPGQFFMLSVDRCLEPLLKRPFSLYRWLGQDFQLLYRIIGKATKILKDKEIGNILEVIGPLGNGFPAIAPKTRPVLVAGGLGIVPISALAESIAERNPILFAGAKTKKELLCLKELKALGIKPIVSTDDGSFGQKGTVIKSLNDFLTHHSLRLPTGQAGITHHCLYACGPKPMLQELSHITKKHSLKGYIALEESMACGIGACLSCVVNTKDGYKRICKEGPVFPMEEIVW